MRLLTRKIYRAFPELDQFDDETCKRYISRIAGISTNGHGCLLISAVLMCSFIAWVFIEYNARIALLYILDQANVKVGVYADTFIVLVAYLGYIWFPWIVLLIARDRWLSRQIRKQIEGACCDGCRYCLVGLTIIRTKSKEFVVCPECGKKLVLDGYKLTRADIDPSLA